MTVSIERLEDGRTKLSFPDDLEETQLILAVSCIYLHAKHYLQDLSKEQGVNFVALAEDKVRLKNSYQESETEH